MGGGSQVKASVRVCIAVAIGLSILCVGVPAALAAPAWIQQTVEIAPPPGADPEFAFTHLRAVSCGAAGACSAIGTYEDSDSNSQTMAVSKVSGKWQSAQKLSLPPGHEEPYLSAISCSSAGNCVAVGQIDAGSESIGLVVEQNDGVWGPLHGVPGPAGAEWTWLNAVSCAADGSCTAVGGYEDAASRNRPMAISESGGVWGSTVTVPGPGGPLATADASLLTVSCAAANSCSALGSAWEGASVWESIVASKSGGTWGTALEIGTPAGSSPFFSSSISCGGPGSCAVGGYYAGSNDVDHPAVAEEVGGVWGGATAIPFLAEASTSTSAGIQAVSCPTADSCAVVGHYEDNAGDDRAFEAESSAGAWSPAAELPTPRTDEVSPYHLVGMSFLDCPAAGSCAALGSSFWRGVDLLEQGGQWGEGEWVHLPANSQSEEAGGFESLSCGAPGSCSAIGSYADPDGMTRSMVLDTDEAFAAGIPEAPQKAPLPGPGGSGGAGGNLPPPPAQQPPPPSVKHGGRHRGGEAHCRKGFRKKLDHGKARCVKNKKHRGH